MGVYIKGMEMPVSCRYCAFRHMSLTENAFCTIANETIDYMVERTKRLPNCPLIEVSPHGELIDRDTLLNLLNNCMFPSDMVTTTAVSMATNWIKKAPTIIEAEEGE